MITAEELLNKEIAKIVSVYDSKIESISFTSDLAKAVFKNVCIDYAREAIKADRANLLNHVKAWVDTNGEWTTSAVEAKVDKDSIINAPNIELI